MRAAIESLNAPGMKKQKTSLESDGNFEVRFRHLFGRVFIYFLCLGEPDSGIDATTFTTSTQASTVTSSTSGSIRPSRSAKIKASGNLVRFFVKVTRSC